MAKQPVSAAPAPAKPPLMPPEERFWKTYSPHYELPLSSGVSITLHVLIIGLLLLTPFLIVRPPAPPVSLDLVEIEGGSGGLDGLGVGDTLKGGPKGKDRTEFGAKVPGDKPERPSMKEP